MIVKSENELTLLNSVFQLYNPLRQYQPALDAQEQFTLLRQAAFAQ
jgi:hypothetical protein